MQSIVIGIHETAYDDVMACAAEEEENVPKIIVVDLRKCYCEEDINDSEYSRDTDMSLDSAFTIV